MNEVSTELGLLESSSARVALTAAKTFGLFESVWCSGIGTDNVSLAPIRDGVCDLDVPRDEQRDDGLELRDWRKSSNGISSDLFKRKRTKISSVHIKIHSVKFFAPSRTNLGRGVLGLDSRERTFPLLPLTRFRDVSRDFAPPTPLFGDRSL